MRYVIITPARNEEQNLPRTIASVVSQSLPPVLWLIVDDGSTDATGSIADTAATRHNWIKVIHRDDRGFRQPGSGVMEAFHDALRSVDGCAWDFLAKLDGDLIFAPDYFERCLQRFGDNPRLGIGGGLVCRLRNGNLVADSASDPAFHVRGATKIYRRECWEAIGGLIRMPGWDSVDELKANMLGWKTETFRDLKVEQLKETGSADGNWSNAVKNGLANYVAGYHPAFMLLKCAKRVFSPPYGVGAGGLAWGFARGYLRRQNRIADPKLVCFVREQQIRRLTLRRSIWN